MGRITLHGITNCDTVKRARALLAEQGAAYDFHDFKKSGVPAALPRWIEALGWERLLNRAGTTWRKLDEAQRAGVTDAVSASALMRVMPSVIKRPVVQWADGSITVGFDAADWARRVKG
jgi:Spx/MgsR family transcriptional regulator